MCIIILTILAQHGNRYKNIHIQFDSKDVNPLMSTWMANLSTAEYLQFYILILACTDIFRSA